MKREPGRTCLGCRRVLPRRALVRLVGRRAGNGKGQRIDATQQQLSEMVGNFETEVWALEPGKTVEW